MENNDLQETKKQEIRLSNSEYDLRLEQLAKDDQYTYGVIRDVNDGVLEIDQAIVMLNLSNKRVAELMDAFLSNRLECFVTVNKDRLLKTKSQIQFEQEICTKYKSKEYKGCSFKHFSMLLQREGIMIKEQQVRRLLNACYLYSPNQLRIKAESIQKELDRALKVEKDEFLLKNIKYSLHRIVHRGRSTEPRTDRMGFVCEADASVYDWLGLGTKMYLTIMVDECTSALLGAYLCETECSESHMNVLFQCVKKYGPPKRLITDRHRAITQAKKYTEKPSDKYSIMNYDTTEYSMTCRQLGINLVVTSSATQKPHVERANQTLQNRLPHELMVRGIVTKEAANEFILNEYIDMYNNEFALEAPDENAAFGKIPTSFLGRLPYLFAKIRVRKVTPGNEIPYTKRYCIYDKYGTRCNFDKDTQAVVIDSYFSDTLICVIDDEVYALHEMNKYITPGVNVNQREPEDLPEYMPAWSLNSVDRHCDYMHAEFIKISNQGELNSGENA